MRVLKIESYVFIVPQLEKQVAESENASLPLDKSSEVIHVVRRHCCNLGSSLYNLTVDTVCRS